MASSTRANEVPTTVPTDPIPEPLPSKHIVAQYIGHSGTVRIIDKKSQDSLIGVPGVATRDLIWQRPNGKLDVTDVHEEVLAYLKRDPKFKVTTVDGPPSTDG